MKPAPAASESAAAAPVVKTGGKYVPPNRRNESGASAVPVVVQRPRKPKVAPNIQSEMDFPTLAMAGDNQRYPTSVHAIVKQSVFSDDVMKSNILYFDFAASWLDSKRSNRGQSSWMTRQKKLYSCNWTISLVLSKPTDVGSTDRISHAPRSIAQAILRQANNCSPVPVQMARFAFDLE